MVIVEGEEPASPMGTNIRHNTNNAHPDDGFYI
jgi:hypothetical protein